MPTATARVNGKVIASSDNYQTVEGNIYFPPSSLDQSVLSSSNTHSSCPWKGKASYYNITTDGNTLKDAAWYYPVPKEKAAHIKDHVAFCERTPFTSVNGTYADRNADGSKVAVSVA
jgi:uncharacterized protein (DUF427 family)